MSEKFNFDISPEKLQKLYKEKISESSYDLSNPLITQSAGDITFLFYALLHNLKKERENLTNIHILHLLSQLSGFFRDNMEEAVKRQITQYENQKQVNPRVLATLSMNCAFAKTAEKIIDDLLELFLRMEAVNSTTPSYRVIKSVGINIKPHEVNDWLKKNFTI